MAVAANPAAREALAAILADLGTRCFLISFPRVFLIENKLTNALFFDEADGAESVSDFKPSTQAIPEPRVTTMTTTGNGLNTPCKTPAPKAGLVKLNV